MGKPMKRLAVICARGGSKGVKGKNLRILLDKPLIAHTIQQAKEVGLFKSVVISSDNDDILQAGLSWGADYAVERPIELANDTAPKIPAIRHCADSIERLSKTQMDTIVDLDATAPLRNLDDIHGAVTMLESSSAGNLVSGMSARRSPYFNLVELDENGRVHLSKTPKESVIRRQDAPKCFDLNASIYVWRRESLFSTCDNALSKNTILFEMPEERSIDIDNETDFAFVEFLMQRSRNS
jgi:N-acylneuraminate cytidylyltransferase/CMP-N,N'-diacetyllegionaminic acid synthase